GSALGTRDCARPVLSLHGTTGHSLRRHQTHPGFPAPIGSVLLQRYAQTGMTDVMGQCGAFNRIWVNTSYCLKQLLWRGQEPLRQAPANPGDFQAMGEPS